MTPAVVFARGSAAQLLCLCVGLRAFATGEIESAAGVQRLGSQPVPTHPVPAAGSPTTGLELSGSPSPQEILRVHLFAEPLLPVGGEPSAQDNADLATALRGYAQRRGPDDFASLEQFLQEHPRSPWVAALLTDLGLEYYNTVHYSRALDAWSQAWALVKDATDPKAKAIGDRAAAELAYMYGRLGRMTQLEPLLKSVEGRTFVGPATEKITEAREGLWEMQHRPEISFRCGPLALQRIKLAVDPRHPGLGVLQEATSTQQGLSLSQVAKLSQDAGMNYQMAFRQAGTPFVIPAVVHWKVGHYAALVRQEGDRYLLQDPTFRNDVWATAQALEAECSGYFLLPPAPLRQGWRAVPAREGDTIWGKGNVVANDDKPKAPCDPQSGGSSPCDPPCASAAGGGGGGGGAPGPVPLPYPISGMAMPVSSVHLSSVNLNLRDQPVGYSPPVGPPVRFWVRYNQRDAYQPTTFTYANFGPKWTCDWVAYINDNPQNALQDVNYYIRGGGLRTFTGFETNSQAFAYQQYDQTLLTRTGTASYSMLWPDGSTLVFAQSDGSVGTLRNIFLSQVIDPHGNTVTLAYDGSLRLIAITDAIGQVTTITYGNPSDSYKITKVTDPFGRFALFAYDNLGRLTNITDVIGLSSQFVYPGTGDFISNLITPYGTNTFTAGGSGTTRFLETVYADGSRDRVEFNQTITQIPMTDPPATVPQGMATHNNYLQYRNTFYWSRTACATSYGDYTKARIYHWLHTADGTSASGILESIKEPLENRVWFDYAGQPGDSIFVGNSNKPLHAGRVLDDGSTQLYAHAYNGFGRMTNSIDPLGRAFSYLYASNGIDLLEVRQTRNGNNELLRRTTYSAQHLPLTITDTAGQTNTYTYNSRGQMLTQTDPKHETTTYTYDPNGYLIAGDGPLPGTNDVVSVAYDAYGRTRTKTDLSGYTLTFDYDALNRLTRITHPDSTFEQITYDRLDPAVLQDRAGRQTVLQHNVLRQLTSRTDPLGRTTQFQWCSCGDLKSLTDPLGRTTTWRKDVQNRLTAKQYGDGSQVTYYYENTTSRVREVVDERLQSTTYLYNPDNTLQSVGFANTPVATPAVSYSYDPDYARLTSMTDGTGTTLYQYVPITTPPGLGAGQVSSVQGPLPNSTITYGYDELGRRILTAVGGVGTLLGFDAGGRVTSETNALGSFSYTYDGASGRMLSETFPNGQTVSRTFLDNSGDHALQRITDQFGPSLLSEFVYSRDLPAGRILTWSQQSGASTPSVFSFGYDAVNQLVSAMVTNAGALVTSYAYAYDPAANRLSEQAGNSTVTATYNPLNELSTCSGAGLSRTNEWDARNRLTAVNAGGQRTEFTYDGLDRLASIRLLTNGVQASLRQFLWCDDELCQERDGSGVLTKRFFRRGVKLEAGPNAGSYCYTRDHLGSVRELTDSSGNARARYSYDPYGRRTRTAGDLDTDFGFAGMFWSSEAALSLTHFRAYDPGLGRWLSRDPLANAEARQGANLYTYVGNNVVNATDPLGLCCEQELNTLVQAQMMGIPGSQCAFFKPIALSCGGNPFGECPNAVATAQVFCTQDLIQAQQQYILCLQKPCQPKQCSAAGAPSPPPSPAPASPRPAPRAPPTPPDNDLPQQSLTLDYGMAEFGY